MSLAAVERAVATVECAAENLAHVVRDALDDGEPVEDVAQVLGVSVATVYRTLARYDLTYGRGGHKRPKEA